MALPAATDVDVTACIVDESNIQVVVEGVRDVTVAWNGVSFSGADFPFFEAGMESYPAMSISGRALSKTSMEITITVDDSGTTKATIPLTGDSCEPLMPDA